MQLVLAPVVSINLMVKERDIVYRDTGNKKEAKIRVKERTQASDKTDGIQLITVPGPGD